MPIKPNPGCTAITLLVIGAFSVVTVTTYSVQPRRACSACQSVLLQVLCSRHVALALMAGGKLIACGATDEHGSEGAGPPSCWLHAGPSPRPCLRQSPYLEHGSDVQDVLCREALLDSGEWRRHPRCAGDRPNGSPSERSQHCCDSSACAGFTLFVPGRRAQGFHAGTTQVNSLKVGSISLLDREPGTPVSGA